MEHQHTDHGHIGNIKFAFVLNLLFAIAEIIGGFLTNSVAIIADAIHDLGDSISLGAAWFFERYSKRGRNQKYSYGFRRFSLLGALINAIVLIGGTVFVLTEIVARLFEPEQVQATGMFWLAVAGILVNGIAVFRLNKNTSLNSRVVKLHLLEDVLGWLAVLIGSAIIYYTGWVQIDAYLSIGIAIWVLYNALKALVKVMKVILQATPQGFNYEKATKDLHKIEGVFGVHDMHVWSLDGDYHIATLHIVKPNNAEKTDREIRNKVKEFFNRWDINHVTIETETIEEAKDCGYHDC